MRINRKYQDDGLFKDGQEGGCKIYTLLIHYCNQISYKHI
jgi:hypothetical protein